MSSTSPSLEELLLACARQDQQAFKSLYDELSPPLYAMCLEMLKNRALAEEALQEGFLQVWRDAGKYDSGKSKPQTWVSVIVRYRALDIIRRVKRPEPNEVDLPGLRESVGPMSQLQKRYARQDVRDCLDSLGDKHKDAILLAFFRGLTHRQISDVMISPLGTVKSWIRRGLGKLKTCLENATGI